MRLDVVVVTYESAGHLPACLGALPAEATVVVVDNASGDRSAAVAEEHDALVVRNSRNRGFAAAANQGAALGQADLLLFLNPDAVIDAPDLERLAASLVERDGLIPPDAMTCGSSLLEALERNGIRVESCRSG